MLYFNLIKKTIRVKTAIGSILVRNGHTLRGKRPGVARSLEQRLAENEKKNNCDPLPRINIGFACKSLSRAEILKSRIEHIKKIKNDPNMERLSRSHSLSVNLEEIRKESECTTTPFHLKNIADHYGIYKDLFDNAYFIPRINMKVLYTDVDNKNYSVFYGNILPASGSTTKPKIEFDHNKELLVKNNDKSKISYYSILMVNPDTHLINEKHETCLNWFVSNIPNDEIEKGEEIYNYLQPIPVRGFGFQRYIFVLFKQTKQIDFQILKCNNLDLLNRKFNLLEFYRQHQDNITPAGLAFFQSEWDKSVSAFYNKINLKEPVFTYDFPKPYLADQKWFPLKQPFNSYMDKHRPDPNKINKEYLKSYLFKDIDIPIKYPMAHPIKGVPSWMVAEIKKERLKLLQKQNS